MRFFTSGIFWGFVVTLCGISIILKAIFHINLPIIRALFGLFVIYWGVSIIFGFKNNRFHFDAYKNESSVIFGEAHFSPEQIQEEYNVIFGQGFVDLSAQNVLLPNAISVNSVFADTKVYINRQTQIVLKASSAFGNAITPDGNSVNFGTLSQNIGSGDKKLTLKTNTVFGQIQILYKE